MAQGRIAPHAGLAVTGVVKRRGPAFTLGPVTLELHRGDCLGLVGANGSGKTTLLRCLLSTVAPDEGLVTWAGREVLPYSPTPGVAGLIEEPSLFNRLTAVENLRATFVTERVSDAACTTVLERVGLGGVADKRVGEFSQGMRQRLGIARILLAEAELVVLDEPTNGLDPVGIRWLRGLIEALRSEGRTIVVSSHLLHEVAQVATHYALLNEGRVFAAGAMHDIAGLTTLEDLYFSVADTHDPDAADPGGER